MKLLLTLVSLLVSVGLMAQSDTTYWTNSFNGSLNFNQSSFSSNWTGGGVNSLAFDALINAKAAYKKNKTSWDNEFEAQFGMVKNDGQSLRKASDRLFFDTKVGHDLSSKWQMYASVNFLTQFANGFKYETGANGQEISRRISKFMAPGYLTTSWGFEYKPADYFWVRLSPFSPRFTFVTDTTLYLNEDADPPKNYGVPIGDKVRSEWLAFQLLADFDKDLTENLNLKARYLMYANYETFALEEIDHRLDLAITAKVAKYISVRLSGALIYDKDQDDDVQLSQAMGIGFVYKVANRKAE
ncbi:DUF3078 domain-containing protein [Flammeovirgaceae bacterium SG7u.111]|nr:DUF3078 domain-containing protein [Flammeovirgaceae bacterium SG7u.132]WPO34541.1 DUF3078 domain-containing protein [Flammeovirgaceae bacterium SG7u.111]